jgi:cytochrome c-type biogenesis protein CcmH/NrfG
VGAISVKKESAILTIVVAFAIGFITGATVVILKNKDGTEKSIITSNTQFPISKEPISIELMEKIEDLKETVRKDPENLDAWMKLGNTYFEHNRSREAIEAYTQYLSLKPNDPDVRTNMGITLRTLGDYDGAIGEFRKAVESNSKHINSRYYLGFTLLHDKQNPNEAIKAWEGYLKVESKGERANQVKALLEKLKEELAKK